MKLGIQTGQMIEQLGFEKGYAAIRKAGFSGVDWRLIRPRTKAKLLDGTYEGRNIFDRTIDDIIDYYAQELDAIRKNDLSVLQIHAPYPPHIYGHHEILDCIDVYKRLIAYCDYIGCPCIVMHPISGEYKNPPLTDEAVEKANGELFTALIPTLVACKKNVTVCIENLHIPVPGKANPFRYKDAFCGDPNTAPDIIDAYNRLAGKEVFGLCLDTGHLSLMGRKPSEYVLPAGGRLKALNLEDNDWDGDWHLPPCAGLVEWRNLCESLREVDYAGDLVVECGDYIDRAFAFSEEMGMVCLKTVARTATVLKRWIVEGMV